MTIENPYNAIQSLNWTLFTFLSIFILFSSCSSEPEVPVFDVRADFVPHVDQFIEEARIRGHIIDFTEFGLSIQFREELDKESTGVCFIGKHKIEIDRSDWNKLSDNSKEGLIFHELGHCELGRVHVNRLLSNGEWASRMRGEPFADGSPTSVINYSGRRRTYYIDELFDETTPEPDWVNISQTYDFIKNSERNELFLIDHDTTEFLKKIFLPASADFEIELEMNNRETNEFIALVWGQENNENSFRFGYNHDLELLIVSGLNIWGVLYQILDFNLIINDVFNKLTVRKIENLYYVFVNEEFVYWFDFNDQRIGTVQSLERGDTNHFRNVRICELLL